MASSRCLMSAFLAVCVGFAACAASDPPIRVPDVQPIPSPMPAPPAPGTPLKLTPEVLFVVDSDIQVLVLASPAGLVSVTEDVGPLRVRGRFVEDPTRTQTKTFSGKSVYTIEAVASGRCEVLIVPVGTIKASDVIRRTVDVDAGQGPIPPPKPEPKPEPKPLAVAWVIVVEETAERTPDVARLLGDKAYWDGLQAKGIKSRFYDDDSADAKAKGYDRFAREVGMPAALFLGADGKVVAKKKVANKADIDSVLSGGKP